jgi:hypothetical protein
MCNLQPPLTNKTKYTSNSANVTMLTLQRAITNDCLHI